MPLLEFLALNVYVASLPLMVSFDALKGGGFENGHEAMDGAAACERVHLAEEDRGYISVLFI